MTKSIIDIIGQGEATKLMRGAVLKAVAESERLGLPKAVTVDGVVYREFPDGTREQVIVSKTSTAKVDQANKHLTRTA
ncbi:MAG: hypothetical protein ABI216_02500 [Devosia sp.]